MGQEITDEVKVRGKARISQHTPRIATHVEYFPTLDQMMPVELEGVWLLRHTALVDHRLPVVFASRLESIELEQPVGRREELGLTEFRLHGRIVDGDRAAR